MIRTLFLFSVLGVAATATASEVETIAGQSNDEDILFSGNGQLFNGLEYDTGVYTIIDDAGLRFFVDADADFSFEMEGRSSLEWPEALAHSWDQTDNGGTVLINTTTDIVAQVAGSIYGLAFTYNIWNESISWEGTETFSSILMPKARQPAVNVAIPGTDFYKIQETVEVAEGLRITIGGKIFPQLAATLQGTSITSGDAVVTSLGEEGLLGVPSSNPGYTSVDSIWKGVLSGNISLQIVPWITVYYAPWNLEVGPIEYDIPVNLFDDTANIESDKARFNHDLPAIQTNMVSIDFGEVSLGSVASKEIQINNLGEVKLDGEALTTDGFFFVSDALISAPILSRDAITVEFVPTEAGTFQGELVLNTNDPVRPQLTIPLVGTAVDAPVGGDNNDNNGNTPNITAPVGCGCSMAPVGGAPLGLLSLFGAGFFIRRRRS
jgi:MYXO-CTERM domain-containing protein